MLLFLVLVTLVSSLTELAVLYGRNIFIIIISGPVVLASLQRLKTNIRH